MLSLLPASNRGLQKFCRGMTILEILLVLAILVVVLMISIPTYESLVVERRLQKSVETLELELQQARMTAIRTGQAQMFRFQIGAGGYTMQPWMSNNDTANAGPGAVVTSASGVVVETSADPMEGVTEAKVDCNRQLEEGISIASANTQSDSRTMMVQAEMGTSSGEAAWSPPVLFYPDGSSTTAEVVFQDTRGRRRAVQVRGLTGQTRVIELPSIEGA